uniref:Uncharacterized protein n=1 Tax=Paramoeba aestuarina TaxID=180227 RepID=A0A7S4P3R0_9EUKA|mmetsp:Transcript_35671/g.55700  ORF Transcript_35671/g.55700 Transcript_35671/m.55700 type:complete len:289 (+) Transcript_35671:7-873(+)
MSFFWMCEKASSEQVVTETQSLSKCLTEFLSCVKTGTDSSKIKEINTTASRHVLHINQLVKVRVLEIPDRDIQSKLTRSCSSIASLTSDLHRQALTALSSPVEFRNLEPVGTKVKAIITEIQAIYTLIHTPTPEKYLSSPNGETIEELLGRSELAMERACGLLEKAGDDEICVNARKILPGLVSGLFAKEEGRGELMDKTLSFLKEMRGVGGKMEEMCVGRREKHKAEIFLWALEHLYRLAMLSAASDCVEYFGGDTIPPFVKLPFVVQQACGCFLQLLSTVFNNNNS